MTIQKLMEKIKIAFNIINYQYYEVAFNVFFIT